MVSGFCSLSEGLRVGDFRFEFFVIFVVGARFRVLILRCRSFVYRFVVVVMVCLF